MDYGEGNVREIHDNFLTTELPNQMMDGYWKGRTIFQLKNVPTRRYHSKAPPDSTAVSKEGPEHTEAQSFIVRNPVRNSQGSPDLNADHGRTLNQKLMTFRDFDDTEFHKVFCWNCLSHLKRKLVNSEHQTVGFTLQLLGFDFIMCQEEHCMSQTKLKSHMICLDRID